MSESISDSEKIAGRSVVEIQGEPVTVRMLKVKEFDKLFELAVAEDETAMIALYTGKPTEWIEALESDDYGTLIEEGERLNLVPFEKWQARKNRRRELVFPGHRDLVLQAASEALKPTPPPEPPKVVSRDGSRALPLPVAIPSPK